MTIEITIDPTTRDKIERRSRRAWKYRRRKSGKKISRITQVTDDSLLYRLPGGPPRSKDYYGKDKIKVTVDVDGEITIHNRTGDAFLDLLKNTDISAIRKHTDDTVVRGYKCVRADGQSQHYPNPDMIWAVGAEFEELHANTSDRQDCAPGINIGSLEYCKREHGQDNRVFAVEFTVADIAAVPSNAGKMRVFRCKVVEEVDLVKKGWIKQLSQAVMDAMKLLPGPAPDDADADLDDEADLEAELDALEALVDDDEEEEEKEETEEESETEEEEEEEEAPEEDKLMSDVGQALADGRARDLGREKEKDELLQESQGIITKLMRFLKGRKKKDLP